MAKWCWINNSFETVITEEKVLNKLFPLFFAPIKEIFLYLFRLLALKIVILHPLRIFENYYILWQKKN